MPADETLPGAGDAGGGKVGYGTRALAAGVPRVIRAAMKYVLAGLAVVAAVAAIFFRPPTPGGAPSPIVRDGSGLDAGEGLAPGSGGSALEQPSAGAPGSKHSSRRSAADQPSAERGIVVYVAGEVVKPGLYTLAPGSRAQAALTRAGGPKADADLVAVNLAARLEDGVEIAVPKLGETSPKRRRAAGPRRRGERTSRGRGHRERGAKAAQPSERLDLNAAAASDLETLPGIGAGLAARIVAYRELNGRFASLDELADVSGITPRIQEAIAAFVFVR